MQWGCPFPVMPHSSIAFLVDILEDHFAVVPSLH